MIEKLENGLKMSFIMFWNLNGAFLRLKGTKFPSSLFGSLRFGFGFKFKGGFKFKSFVWKFKKGQGFGFDKSTKNFQYLKCLDLK